MRVEEHTFADDEGDGGVESHPTYMVEFWTVKDYLGVETRRVLDARDLREVETWAESQSPDQYTIYCEVSYSAGDARWVTWVRVSGFGPDQPGSVADHLSDPEKVRRVRAIMGPDYDADSPTYNQ
ncbi:hypothetical protein [Glaciihabitans sp. dw_435]|uniref:hypothetical protein n=1 Tax=Glaciihabitans sp. dw_435 TaxID=2720081 RepID=UPI001BD56E46|nr:hypothetical protein [Glaciihabitans sp. dw_435]